MRELPATTSTSADLAVTGWSRSAVRHAVTVGRLVRVRRGVFVPAHLVHEPAGFALAVAASFGVVASHRSALYVHGLPVLGGRPPVPEVTVPPRTNAHLVHAHPHRATLRPVDVVDGRVTSVARTLVDVARHHPVVVSVPAMDAALHTGLVSPVQVEEVLDHCGGWSWIRRARAAWALADGLAESPLELVSRVRMHQLRLRVERASWLAEERRRRGFARLWSIRPDA